MCNATQHKHMYSRNSNKPQTEQHKTTPHKHETKAHTTQKQQNGNGKSYEHLPKNETKNPSLCNTAQNLTTRTQNQSTHKTVTT